MRCVSEPEYYVSREAAREAVRLRRQFNVIHPASGMKVDLILARTDPWGKLRSPVDKGCGSADRDGYIARPEDIIISKMRYYKMGGSEKHLRDITGILNVSGRESGPRLYRAVGGRIGVERNLGHDSEAAFRNA